MGRVMSEGKRTRRSSTMQVRSVNAVQSGVCGRVRGRTTKARTAGKATEATSGASFRSAASRANSRVRVSWNEGPAAGAGAGLKVRRSRARGRRDRLRAGPGDSSIRRRAIQRRTSSRPSKRVPSAVSGSRVWKRVAGSSSVRQEGFRFAPSRSRYAAALQTKEARARFGGSVVTWIACSSESSASPGTSSSSPGTSPVCLNDLRELDRRTGGWRTRQGSQAKTLGSLKTETRSDERGPVLCVRVDSRVWSGVERGELRRSFPTDERLGVLPLTSVGLSQVCARLDHVAYGRVGTRELAAASKGGAAQKAA